MGMRLSTNLVSTRNEITRGMTTHIVCNLAYPSKICFTALVESYAIWIGLTLNLLHFARDIKFELTDCLPSH